MCGSLMCLIAIGMSCVGGGHDEFLLLVHYRGTNYVNEVKADRAVAYHDNAAPTISTEMSCDRWKSVAGAFRDWLRIQQVCLLLDVVLESS